jgi:hypothetical protein
VIALQISRIAEFTLIFLFCDFMLRRRTSGRQAAGRSKPVIVGERG